MTTLEYISTSRPIALLGQSMRRRLSDASRVISTSPFAAALGSTIVVLAAYRVIFGSWENFFGTVDQYNESFCDFRGFFYDMGKVIFNEKSPVHGYYYSPFFAIVLGFFGMFKFETALSLWIGLEVMAALLLFYLSYVAVFGKDWRYLSAGIPIFFLSFPLLHNFKWAQVGVFVALLALGGFAARRNGHPVIAVLLIALSVSIKYYTGIFFLYFLLKREYKYFLLGMGVLAAVFILVPAVVLGGNETVAFYQVLGTRIARQLVRPDPINSQYIVNILMRYGFTTSPFLQLYASLFASAGYAVLLGSLYLVVRSIAAGVEKSEYWTFVILSLSTPFFIATSWPHYLAYLPFCQLFLMVKVTERGSGKNWKYALFIIPSIILSSVVMFAAMGDYIRYNTPGFLFWSNALLLALVYVELVPQVRAASARVPASLDVVLER